MITAGEVFMKGYLALVFHVLEHGERREDRTGVGTLSVFVPPPSPGLGPPYEPGLKKRFTSSLVLVSERSYSSRS